MKRQRKRRGRLTTPLVRENGVLREATLGRGARSRRRGPARRARDRRVHVASASSRCSKATNEVNFLAQKFARQVIGINNID